MLILITGTPGTGKTTAARALGRKKGWGVVHLREFARKRKLISGYDKEMDSGLVDIKGLERALLGEIAGKKNLIIEGHLACEVSLPADFVFVLRCGPDELKRRLAKRKYGGMKMEENLMAEMLDYCIVEAESRYPKKRIVQVDTTKTDAASAARLMAQAIGGKPIKREKINYRAELIRHLGLSENGKRGKKTD